MAALALLLLTPLALILLVIYCVSQKRGARLLIRGLVGLVLGGPGGFVLMIPLREDFTYLDAGMGVFILLFFAGAGATVGAYAGVAGAECLSPDLNRRSAARRGAFYGLAGGAALGVLLGLVDGVSIWSYAVLMVHVPLAVIGAAIGAMVGAQLNDRARGEIVHWALLVRRLRIVGLVVAAVAVAGGMYWLREAYLNKLKVEEMRAQREEVERARASQGINAGAPDGQHGGIDALLRQIESESPVERQRAAHALARAPHSGAMVQDGVMEALINTANNDPNRNVRLAAIASLARIIHAW